MRISEQIARRLRGLGLVAALAALSGCAVLDRPDTVASAPPAGVALPATGADAYVRSTRPRVFGQLFQRVPGDIPAAAAPVELAEMPQGVDLNRGERLGFGQVARACGLRPETRGMESGRRLAGFRLYDTAPGSAAPRTMFLSGFGDGCPRAFTGTLAQLAPVAVHEAVRYAAINESPWSATDLAYEDLRDDLCGDAIGEACPAGARRDLNRNAAFVSVYDGFGPEADWQSFLLYDGGLVTAPEG